VLASRHVPGSNAPTPAGTKKKKRPAPVTSADGRATLVGSELEFDPGAFFALQTASRFPATPSWTTPAGQAYRLFVSDDAPSLVGSFIQIYYLRREVTAGEESFLTVYFCPLSCASATDWAPLTTTVSLTGLAPYAVAPAQGEGIYALMTTIPIDLPTAGWNLFSYPVNAERAAAEALMSISGVYTTVYGYEAADFYDPWKVYDVTAPWWVNDLPALCFGKGYWINLVHPVTLRLKGVAGAGPQAAQAFPSPPATIYGEVILPGATPGLPVTAFINDKVCGLGVTRLAEGRLVYSVDVFADDGGSYAGCGAPQRSILIKIGNATLQAPWRNDRLIPLSLRTYFIPLMLAH
jgi:hypothetical protein